MLSAIFAFKIPARRSFAFHGLMYQKIVSNCIKLYQNTDFLLYLLSDNSCIHITSRNPKWGRAKKYLVHGHIQYFVHMDARSFTFSNVLENLCTLSDKNLVDIQQHVTAFHYLALNGQIFTNVLSLTDLVMHYLSHIGIRHRSVHLRHLISTKTCKSRSK